MVDVNLLVTTQKKYVNTQDEEKRIKVPNTGKITKPQRKTRENKTGRRNTEGSS